MGDMFWAGGRETGSSVSQLPEWTRGFPRSDFNRMHVIATPLRANVLSFAVTKCINVVDLTVEHARGVEGCKNRSQFCWYAVIRAIGSVQSMFLLYIKSRKDGRSNANR